MTGTACLATLIGWLLVAMFALASVLYPVFAVWSWRDEGWSRKTLVWTIYALATPVMALFLVVEVVR